jgi:hypothetical protein
MFNIFSPKGKASQHYPEFPFYLSHSGNQEDKHQKYRLRCGKKETLIHYMMECNWCKCYGHQYGDLSKK